MDEEHQIRIPIEGVWQWVQERTGEGSQMWVGFLGVEEIQQMAKRSQSEVVMMRI